MPFLDKIAGGRLGLPAGFLLGAVAFAVAFLLRWTVGAINAPFAPFFLAVFVTAVFAGWRPAFAVLAASLVATWYVFLPPYRSSGLEWPAGPVALGLFLALGVAQIFLVELVRRAAAQLVAARGQIEALLAHERHLYHELQHRVANSIQSLASILSIQAARMVDVDDAATALADAVQRLQGVASVHRRLHDPALAGERLAEALDGLVRDLLRSVGRDDVSIEVAVETPPLDQASATLVAMIAAEATMNSVKHGFAGRPGGKLAIALRREDAGRMVLSVTDNGHGLAGEAGPGPRLGTTIMEGFAQRLGGAFRLENAPGGGARVVVTFPSPATRSPAPR